MGGYYLLSLPGLDLTETDPQAITGSYVRTATAYGTGKPIYICDADGYGPIPATISTGASSSYILSFLTYTATVVSGGTVTVADRIPSSSKSTKR